LILLYKTLTLVPYRRPSNGVLHALLSVVVIPVPAVAATDRLFADVAPSMIISFAGAYLLLAACSMVRRPQSSSVAGLPLRQPWTIALFLSIASYGLMLATFNIRVRLLSFSDVYSLRAVFTERAKASLNYLLNWQANIINLLITVTCLLTYGMLLGLLVVTQWPRIGYQAEKPQRLQDGHSRSGSFGLAV
jgi:hypothetical protein